MYAGTTQHSNLVDKTTRGLDLDYPLIKFSTNQQDWWTIRDAVRGTQIFGGIGSGKSSGSGKTIAKSFLKNGFGGLVLCAKPDERIAWEEYAAATGRSDDLIIFSKGSTYEFNPLEYELTRVGEGAGEIFNLVNLFTEIYKMGNRFSGGSGAGESERFWESALRRCIARAIQLLKLARYEVSISNMIELLSSAPLENEVLALAEMTDEEFLATTRKSFCLNAIFEAGQQDFDEQQEQEYKLVNDYFMRQFATLPDKTRPTILESFLGLAEPFTSGILKQHFAGSTNIRPEMTHEGKIIILDFPVKEFLASGVYAQGIFKLLWQQATERRNIIQQPTPVFLWVDEAQLFLSEYDQIFQTTARSSRACTVFLSQNLSNYYVAIGGRNPRPKADSLLGNLSTKIYHANNDTVTNVWAADTIGKAFMNVSGISVGRNHSSSINQQLHYQVEPKAFTTLKSGGAKNEYQVESIVTVAGREWSDTNNYRKVIFKQK